MNKCDFDNLQKQLNSPEKLHEFMLDYNWDSGNEVPPWIIHNPICDKGTALMVYWLGGARYHCQYRHRDVVPDYQRTGYDLIKEVEQKLLNSFYANNSILFNPQHDQSKGSEGYDWTQEYSDLPMNSRIPAELLEPNIPDLEWEAQGRPKIPTRRVNDDELLRKLEEDVQEILNDLEEND